jgi:hypothetical protein
MSTLGGFPMLQAFEMLGVARDSMRDLMGVAAEPGDQADVAISPETAREAYGPQMSGFMGDVAAAAKRHGILAVTVTTVAVDGIRTISTGQNDQAREVAKMLALMVQDQVARMFGDKLQP